MPRTVDPPSDALRAEVARLDWWHRIDLGQGLVTPGRDDSVAKLSRIGMPTDLQGLRVLDVGAWDGFFSFEAERRGATVVAIDTPAWTMNGGRGKDCFDLAHRILRSGVESRVLDVMELSPDELGTFDLVLCLGVLYHVRDPLGALERLASVTTNQLILETHVDALGFGRPAMVFYPGSELNEDSSNWWGPNERALRTMLRDVGFDRVEIVSRRPLPGRVARSIRLQLRRPPVPLWHALRQGRVALHAFR
ncbi:MAG: class I SAM-dependent methyltransferase [Planctomycetota bacterium]|jgi:tRNA (mo5U34)-methyltransferase